MTSLMRTAGMVALAVVLVVGAVLSASVLTSQDQDPTASARTSIPAEAEEDLNPSAAEPREQPLVEAIEPQSGPGPSSDKALLVQDPETPRELIAARGEGSIILSWLAPAAGTASHYSVTRTHWNQGAMVESFTVDASSTRFVDRGVQADMTYTYTVTSHGNGLVSPPAAVMVTPREPDPQPARALAQEAVTPQIFSPDAGYDIFTRYGATTEVSLGDHLAPGAGEVTFSLKSCDGSSGDYYDSVTVSNGALVAVANTLGHVHGQNTQTATVCTVMVSDGANSKDQEFRLYTVADRTPQELPPGSLTLVEARPTEADVRISLPGSSLGYVRLGWRKPGDRPSFAVARGVTGDTMLTIPGLEARTDYEVRAYPTTIQAFHLYSGGSSASAGVLVPEASPDSKWISNLASGGLGKGQTIMLRTNAVPPPPPPPTPEPTPLPTPMAIRPLPTQEPEEELETDPDTDNDGFDTPETDNDGIDTPTVTPDPDTDDDDTPTPEPEQNTPTPDTDTPTPDTPTPDTPTPDTPTPDTPTPDTPTPDTPEQRAATPDPDTPTPDTPTPDTPTPDTPTPDTPTPDTPTPDTPTPDTPTPDTPTPDTPTPDTPTPDTPTPDTPTPDTPTPDTPTPDTPTPDTPTPDTPMPDTPTPDTPTPDTPTPDTPTPDTPTPDTPTPDTPTPDTPTPDTPTPDTPTPDTPDTQDNDSDEDDSDENR